MKLGSREGVSGRERGVIIGTEASKDTVGQEIDCHMLVDPGQGSGEESCACMFKSTGSRHESGKYVIETKWEDMSDMSAKLEEGLDLS